MYGNTGVCVGLRLVRPPYSVFPLYLATTNPRHFLRRQIRPYVLCAGSKQMLVHWPGRLPHLTKQEPVLLLRCFRSWGRKSRAFLFSLGP